MTEYYRLPATCRRYIFFLPVLFLVLVSCSTWGPVDSDQAGPDVDKAVSDAVDLRKQQMSAIQHWQFDGRISLITEHEAWAGKLYWQQQNSDYFIHFNVPSGQGAMQLRGNGDGVELRLSNGDVYSAEDPSELLKRETDWDLPIDSLWFWIRGLPSPTMSKHMTTLNDEGLIAVIEQNNWHIQFDRYDSYQNHLFPRKIVIKHEDLKLRLVVTNWTVS